MYSEEIYLVLLLNTGGKKQETIKTVKCRLCFKIIFKRNEDGFEIKPKYYSFRTKTQRIGMSVDA